WLGPKVQLVIAVALAFAVLGWVIWGEAFQEPPAAGTRERKRDAQPLRPLGPGLRAVPAGAPQRQQRLAVRQARGRLPAIPAPAPSGQVVASLRPGDGHDDDGWQYATPAQLSAYADWRKPGADVIYAEKALALAQKLDTTRVKAQKEVVERLRKVVPGTSSYK